MKDVHLRDIGVVIVNWNTRDLLIKCIESFLEEGVLERNIAVVDQGSIDGSFAVAKRKHPRSKVLRGDNRGYGNALNTGIQYVQTQFVVFSNADVLVRPGALGTLLKFMQEHPEVGLAGCRVYDGNGIDVTRFTRTSLLRAVLLEIIPQFFRGRWRDVEQMIYSRDDSIDVSYVEGAFMFVRMDAFKEVGGFDEGFTFFFEDADLPLRIRKLGRRVVHVPSARVMHIGGASFSQLRMKHASEFYRNLLLFYERHALRRAAWLRRGLCLVLGLKLILLSVFRALAGTGRLFEETKTTRLQLDSLRIPVERVEVSEKPLISVVVPTYNREKPLLSLLERLQRQTYENFEIVVIDQSETLSPAKEAVYKASGKKMRVFFPRCKGRSAAKNIGLSHSRGEIILFCDDDIEPDRNFLRTHVEAHRDASLGGVSCRTVEDHLAKSQTKRICRVTPYGRVIDGFHSDVTRDVETLVGANMSLKRGVALRAGYFDPSFTGTSIFEEQDLSERILAAGWKIRFTNATSVHHVPQPDGNLGLRLQRPIEYYRNFHHNEILFFLKNRNRLQLFLVIPFCFLRSIKQSIVHGCFPRGVFPMFAGVFAGFKTYYRYL